VRFGFIEAEKAHHRVATLCRMLRVSRAGYYAWRTRPESRRAQTSRTMLVHIRAAYRRHARRYGSPRIWHELRRDGVAIGRHRVARLMRLDGLRARSKRRFRVTTDSRHGLRVAPNRVARRFMAARPNQLWLGDITYLWTKEGWMYLACLLDVYSRRIVGWSLDETLDASVACRVLREALATRRPPRGLVHHSDRGVQYASDDYQRLLTQYGVVGSMSRKGDCWDNAPMESFFATLKRELVGEDPFLSKAAVEQSIAQYIAYYNRERLHSALDYFSPEEYESSAAA
jgi:putative transposase